MRVTASHIVNWVSTQAKEAQANLPRWVRRLCFEPESTRQLSFPAGDSTYVPGWDGSLYSEKGKAWVPPGASRWEIGCDQNVLSKANGDYQKRTEQMSEVERSTCTFVFVTPRRWIKKLDWVKEKCSKGEWAGVRAYDADDLEQWLEQSPAVALQLAEELGLSGWGVVSLSRYWDSWAHQCSPPLNPEALFMDRTHVFDALGEKIQTTDTLSGSIHPLVVRADSVEEAAAFAVAVVMVSHDLQDHAMVVTEPQGWRYVEANPQLRIAIAARTEIALNPILRENLQVIVPHATGDLVGKPAGAEFVLERPNIYEFEKALIAIGMEESDAKRYALSTGRSWTVLRRQRAINPAIQQPTWLVTPQSASLPLLCLLGAWHADTSADRQVAERLAARPYEEIERDLRQLARLDDAPVLNIGAVWKAKSPLELLDQCGDRITSDQLGRFFAIAREMLSTPDPQLELPEGERWMAQAYGKVHPHSVLLLDSVCDSLVKLAVRGSEQVGLQALNVEERVSGLINELLDNADDQRWLSLASYLPTLAEAAPDEFLRVVQKSLRMPDAPVTRLITETSDSGLSGRCWHSGLLWALETLAWSPRRLAAVSLILAQLSHVPMKGNWGNKPSVSLFGLFRSWLPQTAASLPERIKVLNLLIDRDAEAAFLILRKLVAGGPQTAFPAHRPKWREDDAGAGRGVTYAEMHEMLDVAREKLLKLSEGNAPRIVSLLQKTIFRDREELPRVLALIEPFTLAQARDEDREIIRAALRKFIHWHRNYDDAPANELSEWLSSVETCYELLAPQDLVARHRWLFDSHWLELPSRDLDNDSSECSNAITQRRISALAEIYQAQCIVGIERLIEMCAEPSIVGATLARVAWDNIFWPEWITTKGEDFAPSMHMSGCIAGFLQTLTTPASGQLLQEVIVLGEKRRWRPERLAQVLILATPGQETWQLVEACGPDVSAAYWQGVRLYQRGRDTDLEFVLERLLVAKRPLSALQYCQYSLEQTKPIQLFSALQQLLHGEMEKGLKLESWHLEKMLRRLEESGEIDRMALIHLEFGLFPLLRYGREVKANALYEGIMSEPELFKELICLLYKAEHGDREEPSEASKATAERAWSILHSCKRLPGTQPDGSINGDVFFKFIKEARELCSHADRPTMCDQTLGQILAHAPADEDGTWPFTPVRELLDSPELEEMRSGFCIGTSNKRGVTSRLPWDGGEQERTLATYFRDQARRVQYSHPVVATMLEGIAKSYERHGKREDIEASLRKESF
ncbi:hypothetical protein [Pseudomonas protegens]|uniref:hypothetical protein n=1 Tax=Pseudomonas protegens TaxID=380021 RepID=UPI004025F09C